MYIKRPPFKRSIHFFLGFISYQNSYRAYIALGAPVYRLANRYSDERGRAGITKNVITKKCVCVCCGGGGGVVVGEESALEYTGDLKDVIDRLPSKHHYQHDNLIPHLFPLFSSYKSSGENPLNCKLNFNMFDHVLNSHHHFVYKPLI